ncbi:MAG TPA: 3-oxoacyl-[acyl-carrier-protein] reductase [Peptococcaceae bacterium]|jgi:3-oxoacyl-[acyl-carrier protein] reductase|nr:3-oxoacyl-[acyl-carrier-protein] reductase [Clostridia bacterium]HOB81223.1 3-oxoacyl-[acyl-carrier-protein] reductase [Peptococcaceae bacterium]HPZ70718.1 3-oxoacyl-[acyl-carrier-protein] reductase [Peptococcaceae bacterium]HQD53309.1 3-oxoacyl-[acyl-carrier-protein] reductase [Peptococcaceae bacterium]
MLAEQVALITGASRGIGRAIALALAREGAIVYINYKSNRAAAEEVKRQITERGGRADCLQADVSSAGEVDAMVQQILEREGRIDILVNNAGINRDNLIIRMKDEEWHQVIETNLNSAYYCLRAVARPMMKQRRGKVINISSVVGLHGNVGQINYAAAKAGIIGLTKSAAKELSSRGIMVNAIAPGYIVTDMTERLSSEIKEQVAAQIPLGRLGKPEDIANLAVFLAGSGSDYLTGQVIAVDGGMFM